MSSPLTEHNVKNTVYMCPANGAKEIHKNPSTTTLKLQRKYLFRQPNACQKHQFYITDSSLLLLTPASFESTPPGGESGQESHLLDKPLYCIAMTILQESVGGNFMCGEKHYRHIIHKKGQGVFGWCDLCKWQKYSHPAWHRNELSHDTLTIKNKGRIHMQCVLHGI